MTTSLLSHRPLVLCPFPSAISPYADRVQQATMAWADDFRLVHSVHARERLDRLQYGSFMARAYPTASETVLKLIADWNTWLFLLDDELDEHALGREPDQLARLYARLLAILHGAAPSPQEDTRYYALHDLAVRLRACCTDRSMLRFARCLQASFAASVWEARNRMLQRVPSEREYLATRPFTSAVYCFLALIEIAEQMTLPAVVRRHPAVCCLSVMTNNIISWFNDLISYSKEMARGDVHNLVFIVHRERGISVEDAIQYVSMKHDAEVRRFQQICATLPIFGQHRQLGQRYVTGLQLWIQANVDWSITTARYQSAPLMDL
jgi:hypothetical protein